MYFIFHGVTIMIAGGPFYFHVNSLLARNYEFISAINVFILVEKCLFWASFLLNVSILHELVTN